MKKYLYFIFLSLTLLSFTSCNSDSDKEEEEKEERPIEKPTEDDLLGTWEVYYASKQVSKDGNNLSVFRNVDYDGFINKFYKGDNGQYVFENLNLINQIVDKGTYRISKDSIIMDVTEHNGKDTTFQNIERISIFLEKKETIGVYKYFSLNGYNVKDDRFMRNLERAPKVHPNIPKIDLDARFDEIIGTWEMYDYVFLQDGQYTEEAKKRSKIMRDSLKGNAYTFSYDNQGKKRVSLKLKGKYKDGSIFWDDTSYTDLEVKIVDDVIYYIVPNEVNPDTGESGPQAFYLWVDDWKQRIDPETNESVNSIKDKLIGRINDKAEIYYEEQRYIKKIK